MRDDQDIEHSAATPDHHYGEGGGGGGGREGGEEGAQQCECARVHMDSAIRMRRRVHICLSAFLIYVNDVPWLPKLGHTTK